MTEPTASTAESPPTEPTFDVLPLGPEVRRALDEMGYRSPTPVQRAVFEPAAEGKSLVVQARTGTGKTAAFALPLIDRLYRPSVKAVQALALCPTRELALQVSREMEQIGKYRGTKIVAIYGGASMSKQVEALEAGAQIVCGTPGRVLDHLRQKTLDPSAIRVLVLDEADEMLSMGFARELHAILEMLPKNRQGLFFSATIPPDIERLAHAQLKDPELITLSSDQVGALQIAHYVYVMRDGDKIGQLVRILEVEDPESAVIFCNTRDETQKVAEALKNRGFDADWLNGDLPQNDRERVMSATREGRLRFLVATDVAARGIDISHLTHVINHDFPETAEQYVHRTGRTGRAGRTGTAISIIGPKDIGNLYLLRLTYRIRPIEKQLPSAGELKTRAEMDVLQLFVEAFSGRDAHADDLSLARRLLTHADGERIMAGLLRDHLGARGGDAVADAGEARRARNPPPVASQLATRPPPPRSSSRLDEGPAERPAPGAVERPQRDERREPTREARREPRDARGGRDREGRSAPEGRKASPGGAPVASFTRWQPPLEVDDDRPILTGPDADPSSRLPGITVSDGPVTGPHRPDVAPPNANAAAAAEGGVLDDPSLLQLFVNVGKRDGVRAVDLQKLLSDRGVPIDVSNGIRVRDRMTFLRVRKELFDDAVAALTGQVIGGRTVVAELARGGRA
ncbi:MAG TPA: DEAD/DEAH box helicase [Polyangiaceae bacterium]|jgi:ATP-dependent RNA helicase DeaD|nr:DEAD/DEAH box helicase [Polyangiaceae bacterium]